ncbi:hypothetical protein [Arthrobacter sp. AQ5-05]|uniref:hypothetical protein n=1 Tax=Arthrobacter sp. AQ5-05 TaxID=2184581 RepID=UPI0012B65D98|nr:hypothetical protein [Arthrobacter sp. AQ5-05]
MAWRIAQSLLTLLDEVNALHPDRYKGTDGGISGYTYGPGGVVVNPNNQSSHNINASGVVCAFDITTGDRPGGISVAAGQALAEQIRIRVRDQPRGITFYGIHYMAPPYVDVAGPKICTYGTNWAWEPYGGDDPHTSHQHWSADWDVFPGGAPPGLADYDSTLPWNLTTLTGQSTSIERIQEDDMISPEQMLELKLFIQEDNEARHLATRDVVRNKELGYGDRLFIQQAVESRAVVTRDVVQTAVATLATYTPGIDTAKLEAALQEAVAKAVNAGLAAGVKAGATVTVAGGTL